MADRARATVFGDDAEAYETARPSYPKAVIDLITTGSPRDAVDVGCGTGKASRLVAARGIEVTGVEPDSRMASVARGYGVNVVVSPLERWVPTPCDLMYSAQAWHWVDPQIGATVAAQSVRPGGRWAAFWNSESDPWFHDRLTAVYNRVAPQLLVDLGDADDNRMDRTIAGGFTATGAFGTVERHEFDWVDRVDVATVVQRLSTHSSHRLLSSDVGDAVRVALLHELGNADDVIDLSYITRVLTATRH